MEPLKFIKVRNVKSPVRGTSLSAGIDFFIPETFKQTMLHPQRDILIPSGIKVKVPHGYMLRADNKSGVVTSRIACVRAGRKPKQGAFESNVIVGADVVDEDYRGEIHIHLINVGNKEILLQPGMKIAQFILIPVLYAELEEYSSESEIYTGTTERGEGGFGHGTGLN